MKIIYSLSIILYKFLIFILAPFHKKAKLLYNGQQETFKKLTQIDLDNCFWFHVASLGEFEQARPLIEKIKNNNPSQKIALSFFSPSGYEIRKNYDKADIVFYLPLDSSKNAKFIFDQLKPSKVFFIKYEFWHYYILESKKRNIPLYSISTILRPSQHFFKPWGKFYRNILKNIHFFFVQNEETAELLKSINIFNFKISGDTRLDRVIEIAQNPLELPIIKEFKKDKKLIIIGSAWEDDMKVWIPFINNNPHYQYIIAPHNLDHSEMKKWSNQIKGKIGYYTKLKENVDKNYSILFNDTMGILSSMYQYADFVHIGGGFKTGLHNTLEAVTYKIPITIGPKFNKFLEAKTLVNEGGIQSINNTEALQNLYSIEYSLHENILKIKNIQEAYINKNKGATDKIILEISL